MGTHDLEEAQWRGDESCGRVIDLRRNDLPVSRGRSVKSSVERADGVLPRFEPLAVDEALEVDGDGVRDHRADFAQLRCNSSSVVTVVMQGDQGVQTTEGHDGDCAAE